MYAAGEGVRQDNIKSAELYLSSSSAGNISAMFKLGQLYQAGKGVRQDVSGRQK